MVGSDIPNPPSYDIGHPIFTHPHERGKVSRSKCVSAYT